MVLLRKQTSGTLAKISSIKLCQAYRRQFNCDFIHYAPNLYGPGDNFNASSSHVPAALIDRFTLLKLIT